MQGIQLDVRNVQQKGKPLGQSGFAGTGRAHDSDAAVLLNVQGNDAHPNLNLRRV